MRALIDHHLHIDSPVHRWHPTYKLAGMASVALAITCVNSPSVALGALALAWVTIFVSRLPVRLVLVRLLPVAGFLAIFVALLAWGRGADPALDGGFWQSGGVALGVLIALKCLAIIVLVTALLATTATGQLFQSMRALGMPARLVEILLLAYRMVFALAEEIESLRRAAACRGFASTARWRQLRTLGRLAGALVVRALERSNRLYNAMLARGYDGRMRALVARPANHADIVKLTAGLFVAAALVGTRWWP